MPGIFSKTRSAQKASSDISYLGYLQQSSRRDEMWFAMTKWDRVVWATVLATSGVGRDAGVKSWYLVRCTIFWSRLPLELSLCTCGDDVRLGADVGSVGGCTTLGMGRLRVNRY